MHYGKNFFANSRNAISLEPTNEYYLNIIGEAKLLSFHDVQIVSAMYKCKEKCPHVECPKGAFVGKNCECLCKGPPKDPVQRCNHPKNMALVPCKPPPIDMDTYFVKSIGKVSLDDLSRTQYPDGTVLMVENPLCSNQGTGNYTCQDGEWVVNINCKPDRCVYDSIRYEFEPNITAHGLGPTAEYVNTGTHVHVECRAPKRTQGYDSECRDSIWVPELPSCDADRCVYDRTRYVFKPNITSDGVSGTTEYVNSGTFVHVECIAPKGIPGYDSKCTDSLWVPTLPNCDAAVDCKIENFDVRNVEVLLNGTVQSDGDVVPDGSSVQARCKGSNEQNSPINESQSDLVCHKGHLKGQIPRQCPAALFACPIVQFANTSGPFHYGYDVKCFNKYEMQPNLQARFQCDWKGDWKPFVPRCIPKSCQVIYGNANVKVQLMDGSHISPNSRISSGQNISMSCTQKGNVPDQLTLTCDHGVYNETGETTLPVCKLVKCMPPPLSGAVMYRPMNNSYVFKDTVGIQRCQGKLWFQGDQRLTCTADGTWNGTATCTPYCQHGAEKWEERQNSDLIKHTIRNITVESYQECLTFCKNYDRVLCRAFAYGFDQGKRRCRITYANPSSPNAKDMLGARQLWSVWSRKCD
ncbi:complement receptor type 2-like [Dreissena polymorpha]|nr:complement receptor type 2-like [Dreissena polymorpha]